MGKTAIETLGTHAFQHGLAFFDALEKAHELASRAAAGAIAFRDLITGIRTELVFTGQTGWMQGAPFGFIFDSIPNDFVSGELERAILDCVREDAPDVLFLEGQSALRNPSGPCGSELILSGAARGVIGPGMDDVRSRALFLASDDDPRL